MIFAVQNPPSMEHVDLVEALAEMEKFKKIPTPTTSLQQQMEKIHGLKWLTNG